MNTSFDSLIFYTIEKTIKTYRQFAQKELKKNGLSITVDQWLTLKTLQDNPGIPQKELATLIFKDEASVTRIISLLEKSTLLKKQVNEGDGRRSTLVITSNGKKLLKKTEAVVLKYRSKALKDVPEKKVKIANDLLNQIIKNCN